MGSHVVEHLVSLGHFPIIVDNLASGKYGNIKEAVKSGNASFFKRDIRNLNQLLSLPKADAVFHIAAVASVVESISNPTYVNDVNVSGTLNVLEFCRKKKIKKMVFTSSSAIYGNNEARVKEDAEKNPTTVYAASKLIGEQYCKIYTDLFGIQIIALRPFNIYGPRQNDTYAGVISKFISKLQQKKRLVIYGDGKQVRDFIHAKDIARAFEKALSYDTKSFEAFNVATGRSVSINSLAKIFTSDKPIYKKAIPGVVKKSLSDINKIKKGLGFTPSISLEDGIKQLLP